MQVFNLWSLYLCFTSRFFLTSYEEKKYMFYLTPYQTLREPINSTTTKLFMGLFFSSTFY